MSKLENTVDPDYQYITVPINYTNQTAGNNDPQPANAIVNRQSVILNRIQDFYCSVVRMSISGFAIPLQIASLVVGSDYSQNQMIYSFTLTYNGFSSGKTNVTWYPVNLNATASTGTVSSSLQVGNPYYYNYSFSQVASNLNRALAQAFTQLATAAGGLPGIDPPTIYFDFQRQSLFIQAPEANYNINNLNPITIWFNNEAAPLFTNFDYLKAANNDPNGMDNFFTMIPGYNNIVNDQIQLYPFSFDPAYFTVIDSIQIITNLPINFESILPVNQNYGQVTTMNLSKIVSPLNPSSPILFDIAPDYSSLQSFGSPLFYNKQDTYRFASVFGSGALYTFTLGVQFSLLDGSVAPLMLFPQTNCVIKLGFFKKNLFNSNSYSIIDQLKEETQQLKFSKFVR
ncbi:MAG: phage minor capsid protein [Candidatus Falkowbacteria bacterium]